MFSQQVRNLVEVNKLIESLEGSWVENESWLKDVAEEINKSYRKTRDLIRKNADIWFYSQYCECLSYHYYNLGLTHYKLFYNNKIDLESARVCLRRCLEEISKIDQGNSEIDSLKNNAEKFLKVINEIYKKQAKKFTENNPLKNARQCIILGKIEDCRTFLEQVNGCNEEKKLLEQQIKSVQLLRAINTIEDALTVPEVKSTSDTAEYSDCLSRVYKLSRNMSLSERYKRTAVHLYKKPLKSNKNSHASRQRNIEQILEEGIKKYQSDVETVISAIKSIMTLSSTDCDNIKEKYIEHCLKLSLEEMAECMENLATNRNSDFCEILERLNDIKSLNEIPRPFNKLKYYQLLKEHNPTKEKEGIFVNEFKIRCKEKSKSYAKLGKETLPLLKAFTDFLSTKNLNLVWEQLKSFCNDDLTATELLEMIMNLKVSIYGEELRVLQEKITRLKKEGLTDETIDRIKKVIEMYTRPVKMELKKVNNRLTMEVTGKNLVISEILIELNNKLLNNPEIEEVSFKEAKIIHIDANIEKDIWHGKNISIHAEKIKIYGKIIWDVSGKDGEDYTNNAGTDEKGEGKQGADGRPGESGGNVYIIVKNIENPEGFTIKSNGGKGGRGQDGGNGKDGQDGKGITKKELDDRFPPVANFSLKHPFSFLTQENRAIFLISNKSISTNIRTTVENIVKDASEIKTAWYSKITGTATIEHVINSIIADAGKVVPMVVIGTSNVTGNIYIKAKTDQGNKITFSFEHGARTTVCQAFLLYTGSKGKKGGEGGKCGLGGPGGYGGIIFITKNPNVFKSARDGDNGKDGSPGSKGNPGKNGWDMGYMDYSVSIEFFGMDWPKFYGLNQNRKYKLNFCSSETSDRIYCPYQRFLGDAREFAEFEPREIDHSKKDECEVKASTKESSEKRVCQTRAIRKKAILIDKIEEEYFGLSEEDALVKDLESHFEKIGNLKIEIQGREQQKTLVAEAEYGVDFASGCEYQDTSSGIISKKRNKHFTDKPQSNSTEKHRLSELRKAKKQQKSNQAKTEKDSSGKLSVNDCSKLAKVLEEGDKTCAEVLTEDNSNSILESVSVEQVTDKSVVRSSV